MELEREVLEAIRESLTTLQFSMSSSTSWTFRVESNGTIQVSNKSVNWEGISSRVPVEEITKVIREVAERYIQIPSLEERDTIFSTTFYREPRIFDLIKIKVNYWFNGLIIRILRG